MLKSTPKHAVFARHPKIAVSSLALLLCTACGGGGSSNSPSTSTPPPAVNQSPVVTVSKLSVVTEGQPFELDASGSTDREGDRLSYSWRQLSGPSVDIGTATDAKLNLTAPELEADGSLSFEVSVSDGTNTTVSTVSLNVEDLKTNVVLSESTEYGTGGPTTPSQTVPDPSIYDGDKPLDRIIGLTTEADGGYRVHWTASSGGRDMPISSQAFTVDGEKTGVQTDGVFMGGDQGTSEEDGQSYNLYTYGVTFATVQSGNTLYNLNGKIQFGNGVTIGYESFRGLVDGEVDGFGDTLIAQSEYTQRTMGGAYTAIGTDNVLLTLSERTTDDARDPDAKVNMTSYVVDRFGQVVSHDLGQYESNSTANGGNRMTATSYAGGSYLTAWSQNTEDAGYDIRMQRANEDGILLGQQVTVNETTTGHQLNPQSATLTDGNMVVAWLNHSDEEDGRREIQARIVQPNGTFGSDSVTLGPSLRSVSTETSGNLAFYILTPLNTNELLLTWQAQVPGEDGESTALEIRALVLDAGLNVVSNEFTLATGEQAENINGIQAVTLPDNRVVLGWFNNFPYSERDERPDTSHTVGFYPVGRE